MAPSAKGTFRRSRVGFLLVIFSYALLAPGCSAWESFRNRQESLRHQIFDTGWDDPKAEETMAHAEQLFAEMNYDKAIDEFKIVADNQQNNKDMAERARFLQAECRRLLGQYPEAVDTYHKLLIDFSTGAYRKEACTHMYEIANYWLDDFRVELVRRSGEKGVLHWQPSWPNPLDRTKPIIDQEGRALEAMENIKTQDSFGPYADKALFWCGYVNFVRGDFVQADRFFSELVDLYRESPFRPQAMAMAIQSKNNATGGAVYNGKKCAEALQLVHVAEATVPELTQNQEMADKLTRAKFAIRSQQAEKDFRMAEYYERTGHPGSAVFCYELVRRRFSGTRYADLATERKEYLLALLKDGHPSVGNDPFAIASAKWKDLTSKNQAVPTEQNSGTNASILPAGGIQPGVTQPGTVQPAVMQPGGIQPGMPQPPGIQTGMPQPPGMPQAPGIQTGMPQPPGIQPGMPQPPGIQTGAYQPGGYQPGAMQPGGMQSQGYQPGPVPPGAVPPGPVPPGPVPPGPVPPGAIPPAAMPGGGIVPGTTPGYTAGSPRP